METSWLYDTFAVVVAVAFGITGAAFAVAGARRGWRYFVRRYPVWLALVAVIAGAAPFAYIWISPNDVSYSDAALLRVRLVGWRFVLDAYCALAGLAIGGIIGALMNVISPVKEHDS